MNICLTGGIGSGKSTVADAFADMGIDVIDTDIIARQCVAKGSDALERIAKHFGQDILNQKDQLNRQELRDIIFNHPEQKQWLENLLHPIIREKALSQAKQAKSPYCLIVIPLYFENRANYEITQVIVVDVAMDIQAKRVMERDHISHEQALNIITQQIDRETRLKNADHVIENNSDIKHLKQQVLEIHKKLLK